MTTAQTAQTSRVVYPGFKFDVIQMGENLFIIKDQVTGQIREVEHDSYFAIQTCKKLDIRAGYGDCYEGEIVDDGTEA